MNWDEYFLKIANTVAEKSKDRSTKIGCVIVGPNNEIRSTGYNSFPRGINDDLEERHERPEKYLWIEHAERNAIYNAARCGTSTEGCRIYLHALPCMDCARAIVQSGINEVVVLEPDFESEFAKRWIESWQRTFQLFEEAGVKLRYV